MTNQVLFFLYFGATWRQSRTLCDVVNSVRIRQNISDEMNEGCSYENAIGDNVGQSCVSHGELEWQP